MTPRLKPGAFHLARASELTGLRRIYEAPKSGEIPGCVEISGNRVATVQTTKCRLAWSVALLTMVALTADARGIARIDQHDGHPGPSRLVFEEPPQLEKRPAAMSIALTPPNRDPRSDMRQVFQRDPSLRVLGGRYDLFADAMIFE